MVPPTAPVVEPAPACSAPTVQTSSGALCGLVEEVSAWSAPIAVHAYLGVPYAESPAGARRWLRPTPYAARPGLRVATQFGPVCPQPRLGGEIEPSEDCLSLNVWTPAGASPAEGLPVMAFIHGGAFLAGGSRAGSLDGRRLAARGPVVVVSFNYRLGALGFLAGVDKLEGNFGLRDQQLALAWIRDNIRAFGGDPARVTIFGESAGAMSVGLHLVSGSSRGLFRAAIMQSNPYGIPYKSPAEARQFGEMLRQFLHCEDVDCMRAAPLAAVIQQQSSDRFVVDGLLEGLSGELVWAPTVGGEDIPYQPNAVAASVPLLLGTNLDEGQLFVGPYRIKLPFERREVPRLEYEGILHIIFSSPIAARIEKIPRYAPTEGDNTDTFARLLSDYLFTCASRHVMSGATEAVYGYQFAHHAAYDVWPGIPLCAPATGRICHAFELPFVFDNPVDVRLATAPPPAAARFVPSDQVVADAMSGSWTRFAATLDPNGAGLPSWPRYSDDDPARLVFGASSIAPSHDLGAECTFWDSIGYDARGLFERLTF